MKARNQGIASKNVTRPQYRVGAQNRAAQVKGVSQIGSSLGDHITGKKKVLAGVAKPLFGGPAIASKLGNQVAAETTCGVGGSRTIHKVGSQQRSVTRANNARGRSFDE